MSDQEITVSLSDLTPLELAELRAALVEVGCDTAATLTATKMPSNVAGAKKGEPFTMLAVLVVSQIAMTGLALYLGGGRSRFRKSETIVYQDEKGRRLEYTLNIAADRQEEMKADLMKQAAKMKVPTTVFGAG